jgi:hypothetical protein
MEALHVETRGNEHQGEYLRCYDYVVRVKIKTNMKVLYHNGASNNYFVFFAILVGIIVAHIFFYKATSQTFLIHWLFCFSFMCCLEETAFYCNASEIKMFFLLLLIFYAQSFV